MNTYQPLAAGRHCLRQASATSKKCHPWIFELVYCQFNRFDGFEAPLVKFSKSGHSGQMTMPTRRASKFCAKRRALSPEVFTQSLIYWVIPATIEPWQECQPEQLINIHAQPD